MADDCTYENLDLQSQSFRIIRLCKGDTGLPECSLLHAYAGVDEDGMEYEALSYAWSTIDKPKKHLRQWSGDASNLKLI